MEWISSLLSVTCPYCQTALGNTRSACPDCALEMAKLERERPLQTSLSQQFGALDVVSAGAYEGWLRSLTLMQKKQSNAAVVRWLAALAQRAMPKKWHTIPLAWVPGRPLEGAHLVELLALELGRLGHPLVRRPLLARRMLSAMRPQKTLGVGQRHQRDLRKGYRAAGSKTSEREMVVLLDDVLTTGATLAGCKAIIEEDLRIQVIGGLTIAVTPLKTL